MSFYRIGELELKIIHQKDNNKKLRKSPYTLLCYIQPYIRGDHTDWLSKVSYIKSEIETVLGVSKQGVKFIIDIDLDNNLRQRLPLVIRKMKCVKNFKFPVKFLLMNE